MPIKKDLTIIVKMKFGAHLYGTATEESDIDYKGVFLPAKEQVLLSRVPRSYAYSSGTGTSRNTPEDVDYEYYSLHYFIKLACEGRTVAIDMLHAPEEMILETSRTWESIVRHRDKFYTKNLKSLIEYARRQAAKYGIKGSRLNAVMQVIGILEKEDQDKRLLDIWEMLPRTEHCFDISADPGGMKRFQICGKSFQETAKIGYVLPILRKFYSDYGQRAVLAAENKNIDWKAVSHALRAAYQTREILTRGCITYPLENAAFLRDVKEGRLDYKSEVATVLESLMDEVEKLARNSSLPEKTDTAFWDRFICETLERELF